MIYLCFFAAGLLPASTRHNQRHGCWKHPRSLLKSDEKKNYIHISKQWLQLPLGTKDSSRCYHDDTAAKQSSQRKSSYNVTVIFAIIVQGDQLTYEAAVLTRHRGMRSVWWLLSPPFLVMTGGCRQAGVLRRKSRDISPVMTVINLQPSLGTCVPLPKNPDIIKETFEKSVLQLSYSQA